jgi:hypothetical protein
MGRGINGGDPRFAGRSPFMPRKPVAHRLISEHDVLWWPPQKSRPLSLSSSLLDLSFRRSLDWTGIAERGGGREIVGAK